MHRLLRVGALAGLATATACGWYTNIPAQVHVKSIAPAAAMVKYNADRTVTVDTPVITLEGQPGSIGVTYTTAVINYSTNAASPAALGNLAQNMTVAVRVESSAMLDKYPGGNVVIGTGTWNPPLITTGVIELGRSGGNQTSISADITLSGKDDANFPTTLRVSIPVYFQEGSTS